MNGTRSAGGSDRSSPSLRQHRRKRLQRKHRIFLTVNGAILLCATTALVINRSASLNAAIYVVLLSLVCTLPLLFATSYRGKASLMILFLGYYFASFGLQDLVDLFGLRPDAIKSSASSLSGGEIVIIAGALCYLAGYGFRIAITRRHRSRRLSRDWSPSATLKIGVVCWAVGFVVTAAFQFLPQFQFGALNNLPGTTISPAVGGLIAQLRMLQLIGTLLLIYLYITLRKRTILIILLTTMILDFGLGFFGNSKEIALRAPILYILSLMLLRERLPVRGIAIFAVGAGLAFNFLGAYRNMMAVYNETPLEALQHIHTSIERTFSGDKSLGTRLGSGLDYFVLRVSLKPYVDLVVEKTGKSLPFKDGATITPLFYAFVPRIILPNKPLNSDLGREFNHAFHLSSAGTYIAMSQLGELYWNFGWTGVIVGMAMIGTLMAWLASLCRLDVDPTLPRYLLLIASIYILVFRFESGIAMTYTVWARITVVILLLNALVPKAREVYYQSRTQRPAQMGSEPDSNPTQNIPRNAR